MRYVHELGLVVVPVFKVWVAGFVVAVCAFLCGIVIAAVVLGV